MQTKIALDKLCDICPIIGNIADKANSDFELKALLISSKTAGKVNILKLIPKLKEKCENELYEILSIMFDKTVDEIKTQQLGTTIKQIKELIDDEDFKSFFSSFWGNNSTSTQAEDVSMHLDSTVGATETNVTDYAQSMNI